MLSQIITCVFSMLIYMLVGYCLCKGKLAKVNHAQGMSALLIYILGPAMIINSFVNLDYSSETLINIAKCFFMTLLVQVLFFCLLYMFLNRKYVDSKYRILSIGAVLGNVGFLGMPVVYSVFPDKPIVMCYSSVTVMSMNLIVFTIGVYMITNDRSYMSIKGAVINPTTIALIIAIPLFVCRIQLPGPIADSVAVLAKMVTPMCMIILGMRLSAASFKALFARPFVYVTCALKLIAFPVFALLLVRWLPFLDEVLKTSIVVLAMMPSGAIIQSLAELHECEQELAANVVLLTTILSVVTIPLMVFILV